ncbi:hypothetical protein IHE45_12G024000 [Dioscorea alata]|uniref:Uncharacterized protein n=1 Tax=Dioscorea alata TaxID=55571 RepID=A0ACB7V0V5_DIOAL|nr:hypothetical protein IHE45_12G024000 [Dioscorea alata]
MDQNLRRGAFYQMIRVFLLSEQNLWLMLIKTTFSMHSRSLIQLYFQKV